MAVSNGIRPIVSHAVCTPIVEVKDDGRVFTSRMTYANRGTSIRHIMETGEKGESVMDTLNTALFHEAARDAANFSYKLLSPKPIHYALSQDQHDPNGLHLKICHPVTVSGELRNFILPDGDETLGPITMVEIGALVHETEGKTVPFHVHASKAVLQTLATNKRVFDRYAKQIMSWQTPSLSKEEQAAVDVYFKKWQHTA